MLRRFIAVLAFVALPVSVFARTPDDPFFAEQRYAQKIGAPAAWDVSVGSPTVVVAVLDTGVDVNHPDLRDNVWTNAGETADNGVDDDDNGYMDDVHGWDFVGGDNRPVPSTGDAYSVSALAHGTLVAGIVGAQGDNAEGVAGLAWHARLMSVRILDAEGNGFVENAARALDYAVRNGARVVNMSFTGATTDPALDDALRRALDAGVVVVAAVGNKTNGGNNLDEKPVYPACSRLLDGRDPVIGVAATDLEDRKASYSNFGAACADIAAPGSKVFGAQPNVPNVPSLSDTPYGNGWSGTSLASPVVAGSAALLLSKYPALTPEQVRTVLQLSADPIVDAGGAGSVGVGRVNIGRALSIAAAFVGVSVVPAIPAASAGSLIRLPDQSAVYFVGDDGKRHPFPNDRIFHTWFPDFSGVRVISAADMASIPLGAPKMVKPGTLWVKIQSDPKTYRVDGDEYTLQWIMTEEAAIRLGGPDWNKNVIDIEPTYFARFHFSQPVE